MRALDDEGQPEHAGWIGGHPLHAVATGGSERVACCFCVLGQIRTL